MAPCTDNGDSTIFTTACNLYGSRYFDCFASVTTANAGASAGRAMSQLVGMISSKRSGNETEIENKWRS